MGTCYAVGATDVDPGRPIFAVFLREMMLESLAFFLHDSAGVSDHSIRAHHERSVLILEAADVLGVSRRTVYYRIRDGQLQTIRTRGGSQRVLWSSIEALLRSMRPPAAGGGATSDHTER